MKHRRIGTRRATWVADGDTPSAFTLGACESYENGVVYLNYRRKG